MFEDRTMLDPTGQPSADPNQTQWGDPAAPAAPAWGGAEATQQAISITCAVCQTPNMPGDRWCRDCGFLLGSTPIEAAEAADPATLPRLVTQGNGAHEYLLQPGVNTVGRESADVLLLDNQVSRAHARLTLQGTSLAVEDAGSTNGTHVAGRRLGAGESTPLFDGDEIRFGSTTLRVIIPGGTPRPPELAAPAAAPAAPAIPRADRGEAVAHLVREDGGELPLYAGVNSVGRRSDNDVCLTGDPYVSGRHAEIRCEDGAASVVDIGSTNGTFIAGERLPAGEPRPLDASTELQIGKTALRFRPVTAAEATTVLAPDELERGEEEAAKAADEEDAAEATGNGSDGGTIREIDVP